MLHQVQHQGKKGIIGLLVWNRSRNSLKIDAIYLKNAVWTSSAYLYGTLPRYQMICLYVDVYFSTKRASTLQPGQYIPISEFLVQQWVHPQPIRSANNAK